MKQDKETKAKLLASARKEFMEKGYTKASLRNICKNAGVTTGALYFFFQDKEDLFESVTKETVNGIYQIMQAHFQDERDMLENGMRPTPIPGGSGNDLEVMQMIIHHMYLHRDDVLLVLTKSQGTALENIADKFIETAEQHYRVMVREMRAVYPQVVLDDRFIHWLAHEQIDAFIYMITHIENEQEALRYMTQAVTYMVAGWYGLFVNKENN